MSFRFLLDEDTERALATKLRRTDHAVERVVDSDMLGAGATDDAVRDYARRTNRVLVTHDDDHVAVDAAQHAGVLYAPNQRLTAFQLFRIIQQIIAAYAEQSALPPVVYCTENWLSATDSD